MNKQIAADLGIDERSVKRHRTSIMTKLGVHSAAELTKLWRDGQAGHRMIAGKSDPPAFWSHFPP